MKIGFVLDDTLDTPDGVQQYILAVGGWMQQHGHEVHYLVGETTRTDLPNLSSLSRNLRVKFNGNKMSMPLPARKKVIRQLLRAENFDILHIQVPYSPFMAGRLLHLASKDTAIVGTFHILPFSWVERTANRGLAFLNRRTARRFSAMIAASRPAADFAKACYGFDAQVIPHPFTYARFHVPPSTDQHVNLVYMARLVERKGAQWFLKAVAELKRRGTLPADVRVYIGGKGPLRESLEKFVQSSNISDQVTFSGFIPEAEKAAYLSRADIAVFPSTSGESFGISLIEGLAAARGVLLAGDNPGYRSVMPAEAQLHDPTDTIGYANVLEYWLTYSSERAKAAREQQEYAAQFDADVVCKQVEAVYKLALQKRAGS